jgi:hypothetical protein
MGHSIGTGRMHRATAAARQMRPKYPGSQPANTPTSARQGTHQHFHGELSTHKVPAGSRNHSDGERANLMARAIVERFFL